MLRTGDGMIHFSFKSVKSQIRPSFSFKHIEKLFDMNQVMAHDVFNIISMKDFNIVVLILYKLKHTIPVSRLLLLGFHK